MQSIKHRRGGLSDRYPRLVFLPLGIALGVFMAAGFVRNDDPPMAVFSVVILTLFGAYLAFSKSEYAISGGGGGDERQRTIHLQAARIAYMLTVYAALGGAMWELYAGRADGPAHDALALICFVAFVSYAAAFLLLKRRR